MTVIEYKTKGTCSTRIRFSLDNGKIRDLSFQNGCDGNGKSIARLVEGMDAAAVAGMLEGINCSGRGTSCGDQLSRAIRGALEKVSDAG